MVDAARVEAWDHTAYLVATVRGLLEKGVRVEDFHPIRRAQIRKGTRATASAVLGLKGLVESGKLFDGVDRR